MGILEVNNGLFMWEQINSQSAGGNVDGIQVVKWGPGTLSTGESPV